MVLREIFCQDKGIEVLQRAFASGKWAHAYIFAGPEGVGKFKTAREWAKLLLCVEPVVADGFADSCGACQSCRLFEAGSHPDFNHVYKELLEFTKDNADKKTPVDLSIHVIREFLIAKASNRPTLSQRKVFVVSEAERLNAFSQNCLLKVLEEPPDYCSIVLLCTRLEKLLPTTRSRCQTVPFGPIDEGRIAGQLGDMGLGADPSLYFARLAQGSLGTACKWAQLELAGAGLYEIKRRLLMSLARYEYSETLDLAQQLLADSKKIADNWADLDEATSEKDIHRRGMGTVIAMIVSCLHDAMMLHAVPAKELANFEQKDLIRELAGRFDAEQAAEKIAECYRMLSWIESSVNEKLIFEHLLLNLAGSGTMSI